MTFCCAGALLCTVGYLAGFLASTSWILSHTLAVTTKNVSIHCHMFPRKQTILGWESAPGLLLSLCIYSPETGIQKKFLKYLYLMHTFTTAFNESNTHLLSIYNMLNAALCTVVLVIMSIDLVLAELYGRWMRLQRSKGDNVDLYIIIVKLCFCLFPLLYCDLSENHVF